VVANVPYYITGAILRHLLEATPKPSRLVLTVQQEVADRLTADPPEMSLLALGVQFYGSVTQEARIKAGSFWPRPDVDSAVIRIDVAQPPPDPAEAELFFRLARAAFSQKRKQLQKNLRGVGLSKQEVQAMLAEAGIDGRRRAETLGVEEWREVTAVYRARLRSD
jgi:16S rRNA (adenine1518-N6/adenine1519-N6)-dimethyltransferase